jgi:mono/diheme cytochrome c family protein
MRRVFGIAMLAIVWCAIGPPVVAAQAPTAVPDSQYPDADIVYGSSLYTARCSTCHGAQGDGVGGVNLRSGTFRNAVTDQELARFIRTGSQAAGMPPFALDNADMAGIIAYLRNMNTFDAATVKTGVGSLRSAGSLQRSLLTPSSQMMPINRPVRVITKDGTVINGRRLNEDTYSLQIIDDRERLHSLVKADLREYTISTTSPMPSYPGTLGSEEIADVLAYLLSLKGQ